ncbi:unnamed protein product [Periconia digitata]|uniref:Uncharacterized protein n=1 Tax=Periconia digitata TaxID=1303443 RepID=A0A9W4UE39_9PLEO|nr:unnamed protein product [Periconia digitata]
MPIYPLPQPPKSSFPIHPNSLTSPPSYQLPSTVPISSRSPPSQAQAQDTNSKPPQAPAKHAVPQPSAK